MPASDSILLFFIDGLGIGTRAPANPLDGLAAAEPLAIFPDEAPNILGGTLVSTDPRLGVAGRPQSASGQTTILTGVNAPALLGYHKQGFPNAAMREIIAEHSIFLQLKNAGIEPATFANAYSQRFFDERPRWVSATTAAVEAAELQFRNINDLKEDRAVYQDFTNHFIIERGEDVEQGLALSSSGDSSAYHWHRSTDLSQCCGYCHRPRRRCCRYLPHRHRSCRGR